MSDPQSSPTKVALVTGASRGIGRAIATRLAADGARVVLSDTPAATELEACAADLRGRGHAVSAIAADLSDPAAARQLGRACRDLHGRLDVLVNNAAVVDVHRPWRQIDAAAWDRVHDVNLRAVFLLCKEFSGDLEQSGRGRIVNIGSTAALTGEADMVDYVASKSGLVGLTRSMARALGEGGVTVNLVTPGAIVTEAELAMFPDREATDRRVVETQVVRRRGVPEDIAAAVAFLAGDEAGFITGQLLNVDGGRAFH